MKITEQEKEVRKERIIQCAFDLFCKKGIESVSLEDIAKCASVGNTTIYRYFVNKPLLIKSTMGVLWKKIAEELKIEEEKTENYNNMTGREQIRVQLHNMRNFYLKYKEYVLFSYEAKICMVRNSIHLSKEQYDYLMEDIKEPCIASIRKGKQDGSIPTEAEEEAMFYALWGSVRGYIVKIVVYSLLCGSESLWEERYDMLEEGILSALSVGFKIKEE